MPDESSAAVPSSDPDGDHVEYPDDDVEQPDTDRFARLDGAAYDRVNDFLKERVAFTAREWAVTRLCSDFRTKTGVEMTNVGEHLPELVPFMDEPYTPQAVYQARADFEAKVRRAGATFLYGAFGDYFTADEVDELLFEATETAKFLLEVEDASLPYDEELAVEDRLRTSMRAVHEASVEFRYDRCPHCDERLGAGSASE